MVVGGKPYGGRGKTLWWSGEKSYRGRGKFYAQKSVTNIVENAFSLAIRGLVMRITKLYARGSVVSLRMCAGERQERRMSAQHLQEQAISRVLARHRLHSLGDELTPAFLRKRAFPHVPSSAGAGEGEWGGGTT